MATGTLCFILIGVGVASVNLMKLVELLDTPRGARRAARALHGLTPWTCSKS